MKKIYGFLSGLLLLLMVSGNANAVPMTWTDTIDFTPDRLVPPALDYFHDIGDGPDGFRSSFMGGSDTIEDFSLSISIYDDADDPVSEQKVAIGWFEFCGIRLWENEWETVTTEEGESARIQVAFLDFTFTGVDGSADVDYSLAGALDLWLDGTLNVRISAKTGDFLVGSSTLVVNGDKGLAPVPEPATMLLFGIGLLGLARIGRQKK